MLVPIQKRTGRAMRGYIKQSWNVHSNQWSRKNLPENLSQLIWIPWPCTVFQAMMIELIQCTNKVCAILQILSECSGAGPAPVFRALHPRRRPGPECLTGVSDA